MKVDCQLAQFGIVGVPIKVKTTFKKFAFVCKIAQPSKCRVNLKQHNYLGNRRSYILNYAPKLFRISLSLI